MPFTAQLLDDYSRLWEQMLEHRFLKENRHGEVPDGAFARQMRRDYRFAEAACPMPVALISKAPPVHCLPLTDALGGLYDKLELFRKRARAAGIELDGAEPAFICHTYIQFLLATARRWSYATGFTVLYAAEKAYQEAWKIVGGGSPWQPFMENWDGGEFGAYVSFLEETLDELTAGADWRGLGA